MIPSRLLVKSLHGGDELTEDQARRLHDRWIMRQDVEPCRHFQLELLWTEKGTSIGTYACIFCGTEVCRDVGFDSLPPS